MEPTTLDAPTSPEPFPLSDPIAVPEGHTVDAGGDVIPLPPDPGLVIDQPAAGGPISLPAHLMPKGVLVGRGEAAQPQTPTEGRIVRYCTPSGVIRAAIISEVPFDLEATLAGVPVLNICLSVIEPRNPHLGVAEDVPFDPSGQQPHSWHWPGRA